MKKTMALLGFFLTCTVISAQIEVAVHRGVNRSAPENTWAAAHQAIDQGADYLEVDVRQNHQGYWYNFHDRTVDRTTSSTGNFAALDADEIAALDAGSWFRHEYAGARVPMIDSLVRQLKGKIKFYFDFKSGDIDEFFGLVRSWGIADQCFFNQPDELIQKVSESGLPFKVNIYSIPELEEAVEKWNPPIVEVRTHSLTKELVDRAHQLGVKVMPYVPGDQVLPLKHCLAFDIDMINLDRPDLFRLFEEGKSFPNQWIAHRGGVVNDTLAEFSDSSVDQGLQRKYDGFEIDVWQSSDSVLVVHHDETLQRYFGSEERIVDLDWSNLSRREGMHGAKLVSLTDYLSRLPAGKELMIDIKVPTKDRSVDFYDKLRLAIEAKHVLGKCLFIDDDARNYYWGEARFGVRMHELEQLSVAWQKGDEIACHYFLFDHGNRLNAESVRLAQRMSLEVIPSVNTFHYRSENALFGGIRDIEFLCSLGVAKFQIDSVYDGWR